MLQLHRYPVVTIAAMVLSVLGFLVFLQNGVPLDYDGGTLARQWVYASPSQIWAGGYWGMLTAAFVHVSPLGIEWAFLQLGINLFALWFFGRRVELVLGHTGLVAILLFGGLAASGLSLILGMGIGFGASGMIMALIGLMQAGRHRNLVFAGTFILPNQLRIVLGWIALTMVGSLIGLFGVHNAANLGGWLLGMAVGQSFLARRGRWLGWAGLVVMALMVVSSATWQPWNPEWRLWRFSRSLTAGNYNQALAELQPLVTVPAPLPDALNALAWVRATARLDEVRDGEEAIVLAREACRRVDWRVPGFIDTLSAAYAEAGRWWAAEQMQREAVALARQHYAEGQMPRELLTMLEGNMEKIQRREKIRE